VLDVPDPLPWSQILTDALAADPTIEVLEIVRRTVGREPTSAEANTARRAAHRLAATGQADIHTIRQTTPTRRTRQVLQLSRPNTDTATAAVPAARRGRPRSDVQTARGLTNAVAGAAKAAELIDPERISPADAATLAADLDHHLSTLLQLQNRLDQRTRQ
jgi:hypothetical protein